MRLIHRLPWELVDEMEGASSNCFKARAFGLKYLNKPVCPGGSADKKGGTRFGVIP
jgi:hypothetical protein